MSNYAAPHALAENHMVAGFVSGNPLLDSWLAQRARANEKRGASRTFVTCAGSSNEVVGYYSLSAASVSRDDVPGSLARQMPQPVPAILLGRLAVHADHQGHGIGAGLLADAILRAERAAGVIGAAALLVHAADATAAAFYAYFGFQALPGNERTLYLAIARLRATLRHGGPAEA